LEFLFGCPASPEAGLFSQRCFWKSGLEDKTGKIWNLIPDLAKMFRRRFYFIGVQSNKGSLWPSQNPLAANSAEQVSTYSVSIQFEV
jgi:hypothetical protein